RKFLTLARARVLCCFRGGLRSFRVRICPTCPTKYLRFGTPATCLSRARLTARRDFDFLIGNWKARVRRLSDRLVGSTNNPVGIPVSCLGARASGALRYASAIGQIWRDRGRGKALYPRCGDPRWQSPETEERTVQAIPRKVWAHAAFGRGRNSLGRQAAHCWDWRPRRASGDGRGPSGGETARYQVHCGAHVGSMSVAGGNEGGPSLRYPALHVLTRD